MKELAVMTSVRRSVPLALSALAAAAVLASVASTANAAVAIDLTTPGNTFGATNRTLGFEFSVNSPQTIDQLGVYVGSDGALAYGTSAVIQIWDTLGNRLEFTQFDSASGCTARAGFCYVDITPFALTAGVDYVVGANLSPGVYVGMSGTSLNAGHGGAGSYNPLVNVIEDQYSNYEAHAQPFPSNTDGTTVGGAYLGANFNLESAAVPEPAAWMTMLLGFFGLGAILRGERRRALAA